MNTERIIHRRARHELSRYTMMLGSKTPPYEVFQASTYSGSQAYSELEDYVIALERAAQDAE
jgi:hypothetical protein